MKDGGRGRYGSQQRQDQFLWSAPGVFTVASGVNGFGKGKARVGVIGARRWCFAKPQEGQRAYRCYIRDPIQNGGGGTPADVLQPGAHGTDAQSKTVLDNTFTALTVPAIAPVTTRRVPGRYPARSALQPGATEADALLPAPDNTSTPVGVPAIAPGYSRIYLLYAHASFSPSFHRGFPR